MFLPAFKIQHTIRLGSLSCFFTTLIKNHVFSTTKQKGKISKWQPKSKNLINTQISVYIKKCSISDIFKTSFSNESMDDLEKSNDIHSQQSNTSELQNIVHSGNNKKRKKNNRRKKKRSASKRAKTDQDNSITSHNNIFFHVDNKIKKNKRKKLRKIKSLLQSKIHLICNSVAMENSTTAELEGQVLNIDKDCDGSKNNNADISVLKKINKSNIIPERNNSNAESNNTSNCVSRQDIMGFFTNPQCNTIQHTPLIKKSNVIPECNNSNSESNNNSNCVSRQDIMGFFTNPQCNTIQHTPLINKSNVIPEHNNSNSESNINSNCVSRRDIMGFFTNPQYNRIPHTPLIIKSNIIPEHNNSNSESNINANCVSRQDIMGFFTNPQCNRIQYTPLACSKVNSAVSHFISNPIQQRSYSDVVQSHKTNKKEDVNLKTFLKSVRREKFTPYGNAIKHGWNTKGTVGLFKVVSYNVLAQTLLESHYNDLYRNHKEEYLQWDYRKKLLLDDVIEFDADILCFQEIDKEHLTFYNKELGELGYKGIFKKRTGSQHDGCAIYYRDTSFELKESTFVEYYQPLTVLDRDNVGIIVRLVSKKNGSNLVVSTTHLLFNPKRQSIRFYQLQVLLAEIERLAYISTDSFGIAEYHPIILTGDFNQRPHTPVYDFLMNSYLRYSLDPPFQPIVKLYPVPKDLVITNNCQHLELVKNRDGVRSGIADFQHVKLFNTERKSLLKLSNIANAGVKEPVYKIANDDNRYFDTGVVSFNFRLSSAYPYKYAGDQVSTFHDPDWCNVDYILYGPMNQSNRNVIDGKLKLISYLTLPTAAEARTLHLIPNEVCGSDHLPLVATFALPIP